MAADFGDFVGSLTSRAGPDLRIEGGFGVFAVSKFAGAFVGVGMRWPPSAVSLAWARGLYRGLLRALRLEALNLKLQTPIPKP